MQDFSEYGMFLLPNFEISLEKKHILFSMCSSFVSVSIKSFPWAWLTMWVAPIRAGFLANRKKEWKHLNFCGISSWVTEGWKVGRKARKKEGKTFINMVFAEYPDGTLTEIRATMSI